MIRAALYGRYSTDGQRETSIDDQFRNCERYAAREGWTIVARYDDKAISGTTDETGRPGYRKMLAAARAKQFDVLLVDDLSRLSRDSMRTEEARRLFVFLGVRLLGVSDGIDTANKGHKLLTGVKGVMNDVFRDDLAEKTHRGLAGQALKGLSTGGRAYGYRHVPITDPIRKDAYGRPEIIAAKREIDETQASVVRQIFIWSDEGHSPRWIAGELNRLGVPAPGAAYARKNQTPLTGTWSASALHGDPTQGTGLLNNPLYIGRLIWNRRHWVRNPETNRKSSQLRPPSEWIEVAVPELRIVDQALWDRVHARKRSRFQMRKGTPAMNVKYLLSGLLKCGICESKFVIADSYRYGCAGHLNRRHCTNHLRVPRKLAETRCLEGLRRELFTPDRFALFVKEMTRLLTERKRQQLPDQLRQRKELAAVETKLSHLVEAITQGCLTVTTKAELERLETERDRLRVRLANGPGKIDNIVALLPRAQQRYEAVVNNLSAVPQRYIGPMREQLRDLVGEIILRPTTEGYLEAELTGRYEGLFKLAVGGRQNSVGCGERI